jgi:hypothetical protein
MPEYLINAHEREDGSLPINEWVQIANESHIVAIQEAVDLAIIEGKDFIFPFNVYVAKGLRLRWPNETPMCCTQYKIGEVEDG